MYDNVLFHVSCLPEMSFTIVKLISARKEVQLLLGTRVQQIHINISSHIKKHTQFNVPLVSNEHITHTYDLSNH